jgi:hypothetical protein
MTDASAPAERMMPAITSDFLGRRLARRRFRLLGTGCRHRFVGRPEGPETSFRISNSGFRILEPSNVPASPSFPSTILVSLR